MRDDPGLAGLSDKDITKRVMPFAQFRMKEALRGGKQVSTHPSAEKLLMGPSLAS